MIVQDLFNQIKSRKDYVINSLIVKSYDTNGIVVKFLVTSDGRVTERKEMFIAVRGDSTIPMEQWEVIDYWFVEPPQ